MLVRTDTILNIKNNEKNILENISFYIKNHLKSQNKSIFTKRLMYFFFYPIHF